eukprot:gb/GEZN01017003.1/.p1 GENE.gb/GEZN01017003.1/~~gb/GEZN01017003.1/.p1  ORF type:complete len:149 (+),score=16.48 gb/GEZN01017003.1/:246-692(+)
MSLIVPDAEFTGLLRVLNTNIDGTCKAAYALTRITGIGRRFANLVLKRADIDLSKRAGELTEEEVENIRTIIDNPEDFNIPRWFLNRQKDRATGKYLHKVSNHLDVTYRDDIERMKKIRLHRGLRHYWQVRVRGQHTCTTGRRGKAQH